MKKLDAPAQGASTFGRRDFMKIGAGGAMTGYAGGLERKVQLLTLEDALG